MSFGVIFVVLMSCAFGKSEIDCVGTLDSNWEMIGDVVIVPEMVKVVSNASIRYLSRRNRKKWQLNVCGTLSDSLFIFDPDNFTADPENSKGFQLRVIRLNQSILFHIQYKLEVLSQPILTIPINVTNYCITILSGRGFVGILFHSNAEKQEMVAIHELVIPRDSFFSLVLSKPCNISKLCIGDYLGVSRHHFDDENQWSSTVRDFL
jgi:hypothetical protein